MKKTLNSRQLAYCKARVQGFTQAQAYLKAGYAAKTSDQADKNAWLTEHKPHVARYIQKLRDESFAENALSVAEIRSTLAKVVRTAPDDIDGKSPLVQESHKRFTRGKNGSETTATKVKMPDKLRAIELDCKISGAFYSDRNPVANNPFMAVINIGRLEDQGNKLIESQPSINAELVEPSLRNTGDDSSH